MPVTEAGSQGDYAAVQDKGKRRAEYRDSAPEGRKHEVLEPGCEGDWVPVTVLTVVDGRPNIAV